MFPDPACRTSIVNVLTEPPSPLETSPFGRPPGGWRLRLYAVIFESDTRAGRRFDQWLVAIILLSIAVVVADSVQSLHLPHQTLFALLEWGFTLVFTVEYLARLACVRHPWRYATSFFGIVDLVAIVPTYLALLVPEAHAFIDVRVLRLLRIFRIFKLTAYVAEYQVMIAALVASRRKIMVFISAVAMIVLVAGTIMYVIEGPANGFVNIPTAVYWAITTMTTVGFGDITPKTDLGRAIASAMMLIGWGTLAVPTGIVTAEMTARHISRGASGPPAAGQRCTACGTTGHDAAARFCSQCGAALPAGPAAESSAATAADRSG